jgi:hypothetical protein
MIKVIYFNQWFSSITDVIADMKKKHEHQIKVIASSKNPYHVYKDVVDEFIVEDWEEGSNYKESMNNYMNWIVKTCQDYKVDIFFAKKHQSTIAKNIEMLKNIGVFTIIDDYETIRLLEDKAGVYDRLDKLPELHNFIPDYYCGSSLEALQEILHKHTSNPEQPWCFKLNSDEGGLSFRKIVENKEFSIKSLSSYGQNTITLNELTSFIQSANNSDLEKLLFMELLDSPEISVDCYNSRKGFIAICREKVPDTRIQKIYFNKQIYDICQTIGKELKLRFPFNVQFRIKHKTSENDIGNLRLLEINPRLSGGTYYQTLFNMNICDVVLCDMMNRHDMYNIDDFLKFKDGKVTHVEKAVRL